MKATELRIGNWAMYSSKIQVNENKIRECVDHPDRFAPIPLTEEWLKRFGFMTDISGLIYKDVPEAFLYLEGEVVVLADDENEKVITSCKHVHQLQNLYFALTGEELNQNK